MTMFYLKGTSPSDGKRSYILSKDNQYPLNLPQADFKKLLKNLESFELEYTARQHLPPQSIPESQCYDWAVTQRYSFRKRGEVEVTLSTVPHVCKIIQCKALGLKAVDGTEMFWLNITMIVFGMLSFVLQFKYIYEIAKIYNNLQKKFEDREQKV